MNPILIGSFEDFEKHNGQALGASEYFKISQKQINLFADATHDHQWIHCDPERAKSEGAFGNTIAHGYLTLSIVPHLWEQIVQVTNLKMMINYGIENLRFAQAVTVESEVRLVANLKNVANLRGTVKAEVEVKLEIKDQKSRHSPACWYFCITFSDQEASKSLITVAAQAQPNAAGRKDIVP